jgi:hypothetical protein
MYVYNCILYVSNLGFGNPNFNQQVYLPQPVKKRRSEMIIPVTRQEYRKVNTYWFYYYVARNLMWEDVSYEELCTLKVFRPLV